MACNEKLMVQGLRVLDQTQLHFFGREVALPPSELATRANNSFRPRGAPMIGKTVIGKTISHYRIRDKIGEGGMGIVYKAEDTRLKRMVALKFLPPELTRDPEAKNRFTHEAQAASSLDHPNICTIHEIDETEEGQMFIAMAFCEGETVSEKVKRGPLKLSEALSIAIQAALGLSKAHEKGIVHRDIKAANLMVAEDGVLKIVDFGLAKLRGETRITRTGTTLGTVAYMSPEQARGEIVDHRTDLWSLGVVLYEMITGRLPFAGDYEQAVIYGILNEEPEPVTGLRTGVPVELEQVVTKALAKAPEERYQHADEMLVDLRRIERSLAEAPLRQMRAGPGPPKRRWLTSPLLWTTIIVLFGLAGGVLLFYPTKTIPFSERDWVLITDFENLTGEEVFDESLSTAFAVSIGQSRYLNVFPKRRIRETLRRMKRAEVDRIDDTLAREIAEREGIKVVLVPSISRVGDRYALTAVIQDANSGTALQSHIVQARGQADVLNALDDLTRRIRRELGETMAAISQQSKPLVKVTTSSLPALKQYSLAIQKHRQGNIEEARVYYENALRIDSTFTAARASLGMLHFEMGGWMEGFDREKGKRLLARVAQNVDRLTDTEKYGILAFYSQAVENDLEKAAEYQKALLALYPDYSAAHNNLGRVYQAMGRYRDAISEYEKAIQLDPYLMPSYNSLALVFLYELGEMDSARVWTLRQLSRNPNSFWACDHLGWAYLGLDSLEQAEAAFERALQLNPTSTLELYRLGHALRLQGKYAEAIEALQKIRAIDPADSWALYQLGVVYDLMGDRKTAREYFERFRQVAQKWVRDNPDNSENYLALGLVLTRLGQRERGWAVGQRAMAVDSSNHFGFAQLLSVQGKKQDALEQLQIAVKKGFRNFVWMKIHPDLQALYDEPGFKELTREALKMQ
jgi:serine/threonine protein kinase/tetratricopeptide (TPR) repeat protein